MTVNAINSSVLDSLTSHIAVLNAQGVIVAVNKAWRQFGTENGLPESSHSMLGANYLDTCKNAVNQPYGDEENAAQAGISAVLAGKQESFYLEYPCHSPNQQRWFSMKISPLQDSVGGVVVSHENITERKLAEKKLAESESIMATVLENVSAYIFLKDTEGRYTFVNKRCLELWDLPIEKVIGVTNEDLFDPQFAATIREIDLRVLVNGESIAREESGTVLKTGKTATYWAIKIPLRNAEGSIYGLCGISTDITALKELDEGIQSSKAKLEAALASMNDAVFISDTEGRFIEFNEAFATFHKFKNKEDCPKTLAEYPNFVDVYSSSGEFLPLEQRGVPRALRGETGSGVEFTLKRRDTGETWIGSYSYAPIRNNDGLIVGSVVTARDITDYKQAETALQQSQANLQEAQRIAHVGSWQMNVATNHVSWSEQLYLMLGLNPALPQPDYSEQHKLFAPESWERLSTALAHTAESGIPYELELEMINPDGNHKWMQARGEAVRDANGAIVALQGIALDITERKQAENALKISEEHFRSLFTQAPLGIALIHSLTGHIYKANQRYADIVGLSLDELERIDWMQITHPDDVQADLDNMALMNAGKTNGFVIEKRYIHADGSIVWVNLTVAKILLKEQCVPCHHCIVEDITERKKIREALNASEKEFRLLAESMPQIVWITRDDGESIYLNQQWVNYTGFSLEESYGHNWCNAIHPDDRQRAWDAWQTAINNKSSYSFECRLRRADGVYRWWLDRGVPVCDETGKIYKWFGTCTDIHELKESEKSLRIAAIAFESQEAMVITDANQIILKVNQAFTRMTGYSAEEAIGNTPALLKSGNQDKQFYDTMWEALNSHKFWTGEIWNRRKNGELYPEWLSISVVTDVNGQVSNYVATFTDITASKKLEETIHHLAFYDPLTHLPNRRLMLDRLKQALISRKLKNCYGAILFIDLNDFKTLNDTKGHDSGDLLLIEVATLLQVTVHEDDTVARTGADEFVVLIDTLDIDTNRVAIQVEAIAKKILTTIGSQPFNLQDYEYRCSASIGIALFHSHEISVDELIKQADMAMHQAKQVGKNTICFFDPAIQAALEFRVQLESWMHNALNEQYRLYFQIQIDDQGKATGAESLIRWHHPEQGIISPIAFIPLAEQTGLILSIGQWVLETACTQLKAWEHNEQTQHLILAVNVSAKQFYQPNFVKQVLAVLEQTGANPDKLKLELTESMLVDNVEDIIVKMNVLKAKGVKFSLDDFGTGFSSLSYLKRLPLSQLKIDQSFVHDALIDSKDAAIIRTIIALGHSLGMDVIAEGVETDAQRHFLAALGCNHYQGYLFSKPLPLEEFEQLLCKKML